MRNILKCFATVLAILVLTYSFADCIASVDVVDMNLTEEQYAFHNKLKLI